RKTIRLKIQLAGPLLKTFLAFTDSIDTPKSPNCLFTLGQTANSKFKVTSCSESSFQYWKDLLRLAKSQAVKLA
ncbi:hypothetical protein, partial [Staphylococcus aureus]